MSAEATPVKITILGKEYRIACPETERQSLMESSQLLDDEMRKIRSAGKVIGTDRIAVMAALNLAHDLLQQRCDKQNTRQSLQTRIQRLQDRIDMALNHSDPA
ncbi:MAG: cell division protein ZapA [gamma proteobacterium symbiont of Bathyaustriella thionipta]|nr:cell division protein ZapA [gamma proteobacterium symbiont of Bathyaustriella thionipta]